MKSSWEMQTEYGERKTWGEYRKEFLKKKGKFELEHEMIGTDFSWEDGRKFCGA